MQYADILKLSFEELEFILGEVSLEEGTLELIRRGITLVAVTLGPKGCFYRFGTTCCGYIPTYDVSVVDTTGAGDAFLGALLYKLWRDGKKLSQLSRTEIEAAIDFGNAAGARTTVKKGAIPALPILAEIADCQKSAARLNL